MKQPQKRILDHNTALEYLKETLEDVNLLSKQLIQEVDFKQGTFFTYLPKLPLEWPIHDFKAARRIIGNVQEGVVQFISSQISQHPNLQYIVDHVIDTYDPRIREDVYDTCGVNHLVETYYLITQKTNSAPLIEKCLQRSNAAVWHGVSVVFSSDINIQSELMPADVKEICRTAKLILNTAYDAEGYVFWEKNSDIISMGPTLEVP